MLSADRAFLENLIRFSGYNRIVTVLSYREALSNPLIAINTWMESFQITEQEAMSRVVKQNALETVKEILIVKIFSEFVAALEDFGALCYAIKERKEHGIFYKFYQSETKHVGNYYKYVEDNQDDTIDKMLNIEPISKLEKRIKGKFIEIVRHDYNSFINGILQTTKNYRVTGDEIIWQGLCKDIPANKPNSFYVVLDFRDPCDKELGSKGIFPTAHNKAKHRFSIYKSLEKFRCEEGSWAIKFATLNSDAQLAQPFITNTIEVSRRMLEISCFILELDARNLLTV